MSDALLAQRKSSDNAKPRPGSQLRNLYQGRWEPNLARRNQGERREYEI